MALQVQSKTLIDLIVRTERHSITGMNIIFDLSGVLFDSQNDTKQQSFQGATHALRPVDYINTVRLLHDCIKLGHRLFVVSNLSKEGYDFLLADPQYARLFDLFDDVILSEMVGIKKPDPRIFDHLISKHRLDPRKCIFIDDHQINLHAAQQAGIAKAILCKNLNMNQVRQELQLHGAL